MVSLDQLVEDAKRDFSKASDPAALEDAKARYLGKSGLLTERLKALGGMSPEERKSAGAEINQAKTAVENALNARRQALADQVLQARLAAESIDVSLPGRGQAFGSLHPVMRTWERVETIFHSIGFDVADGPEIETDWFNFTALNSPENHPARSTCVSYNTRSCNCTSVASLSRVLLTPPPANMSCAMTARYTLLWFFTNTGWMSTFFLANSARINSDAANALGAGNASCLPESASMF